jgi:hypothetical protein
MSNEEDIRFAEEAYRWCKGKLSDIENDVDRAVRAEARCAELEARVRELEADNATAAQTLVEVAAGGARALEAVTWLASAVSAIHAGVTRPGPSPR